MTEITLTERITLPTGYTSRAATLDDLPALTALENACLKAWGEPDEFTVENLKEDYTLSDFDITQNCHVILAADGSIVGSVTVWMRVNPPVHPWIDWFVHPAQDVTTLGKYLLTWGEQLATTALERCPPQARVAWRAETKYGYTPDELVLQAMGAQPNRHFYRMLIELEQAPPAPVLPPHLRIRPMQYPAELPAVVEARIASFRDHWGFIERPPEVVLQDWREFIAKDEQFDPELHFVVEDTTNGTLAGISLCRWDEWGNTDGYVKTLGVRREYRKLGLGLALLHHTFGVFWERGKRRVALHVDASNPTGALRLYQRAGMHVERHYISYEKELRGGEELANPAE
jgi:ribosomal protein S18 acetylase RimI-like enzyme